MHLGGKHRGGSPAGYRGSDSPVPRPKRSALASGRQAGRGNGWVNGHASANRGSSDRGAQAPRLPARRNIRESSEVAESSYREASHCTPIIEVASCHWGRCDRSSKEVESRPTFGAVSSYGFLARPINRRLSTSAEKLNAAPIETIPGRYRISTRWLPASSTTPRRAPKTS